MARVAAAVSDAGVNLAAANCVGNGERAQMHILVPHPEATKHALALSNLAVSHGTMSSSSMSKTSPVCSPTRRRVAKAGVDLEFDYVATSNRVVFGAKDIAALGAALGVTAGVSSWRPTNAR